MSNKKLVQRCGHSAAVLTISPQCIEVILFGGKQFINISAPFIADTAVLRFGKISINMLAGLQNVIVIMGLL